MTYEMIHETSAIADMYDIFGDGADYEWALYDEEVCSQSEFFGNTILT